MTTKVCLFCSSSDGVEPKFYEQIESFCSRLPELNVPLVYGAASCGLMGHAADAALKNGGRVEGIIPDFLAEMREVLHPGISETVIVDGMFPRKKIMFDRSHLFVTFPGGIGTLDEFFEVITWRQLGQLSAPMLLVNIDGFWNPLLALLEHIKGQKMLREDFDGLFDVCETADQAISWVEKQIEEIKC